MLLIQHQAKVFADNGMSVYQDVAQVTLEYPYIPLNPFMHVFM